MHALILVVGSSIEVALRTPSSPYRTVVMTVQCLTLLNACVMQSAYLQEYLHTMFVFLMTFGSFVPRYRAVAVFCNVSMLVLRVAYDKCVFLWWNEGRNMWNDALGLVMLVASPWISPPEWLCFVFAMSVALVAHHAEDPR